MSDPDASHEGKVGPGPSQPEHPAREEAPRAETISSNGIAVWGSAAALVSLILAIFVPIPGFILAVVAVVMSWSGYSQATMGAPHKGLALAGVIVAAAAMVLSVVGFFGIFSLVDGSP